MLLSQLQPGEHVQRLVDVSLVVLSVTMSCTTDESIPAESHLDIRRIPRCSTYFVQV
jgi:hypothetical protein